MNKGCFVISLDFELLWGQLDQKSFFSYGKNVLKGREVIPNILSLFEKYGIHATWAVVGFLATDDKEDLVRYSPSIKPSYTNVLSSSYNYLDMVDGDETTSPLFFGSSIVKKILKTKNQEIGTHTFSHYYCLEDGANIESFCQDLLASKKVIKEKYGVDVISLVFPRNQSLPTYIEHLKELGINVWRGNPIGYSLSKNAFKRFVDKVTRFADTYIPICGHLCFDYPKKEFGTICVNASRFLRPYNKHLFFLEWMKIKRIKGQMKYAAKKKKMFHLWWHPHNFGSNPKKMLKQLESILSYYSALRQKYGFESRTMNEFACSAIEE